MLLLTRRTFPKRRQQRTPRTGPLRRWRSAAHVVTAAPQHKQPAPNTSGSARRLKAPPAPALAVPSLRKEPLSKPHNRTIHTAVRHLAVHARAAAVAMSISVTVNTLRGSYDSKSRTAFLLSFAPSCSWSPLGALQRFAWCCRLAAHFAAPISHLLSSPAPATDRNYRTSKATAKP